MNLEIGQNFFGSELMPKIAKLFFTLTLLVCSAADCTNQSSESSKELANSFSLDAKQAITDLKFFTKKPHPFGSSYQVEVGDYLIKRAREVGADNVEAQSFKVDTPNPEALDESSGPRPLLLKKSGRNIIASLTSFQTDCWYIVGSHYDTKVITGIPYLGANDSGSSSALLLQLLDHFRSKKINHGCDLLFVWFDGEEPVLPDWTTGELSHPAQIQDNTYGSRHFVSQLSNCGNKKCYLNKSVRALILLDMVGMPNLALTRDLNSTPELLKLMISSAAQLGLSSHIASTSRIVEDDHIPFLKAKIPSLNMINFEDLSVWHREGDEIDAVSTQSIEIAGKIASLVISRIKTLPKDL